MAITPLSWAPAPATEDITLLPVGRWWDAIRVTATLGEHALRLLGRRSGAVIQDDTYGKLYWLIEPDSARSWHLRHVRVLTALIDEVTLLGVPPVEWTAGPGLYWRTPLTGRHLTDTRRLHEALVQASMEVLDPLAQSRQLCYMCQLPTDEPTVVAIKHGGSVGGTTIYACPRHAACYPPPPEQRADPSSTDGNPRQSPRR